METCRNQYLPSVSTWLNIGFQVKLHFTDGALRIIAKKAMSKNTGARGLRTILETILMDSMYEVCCMMILYSLSIHLTCKVYGVGILIVVTAYN